MDFKCIYFGYEMGSQRNMLDFVDKNWDRVFNIFYNEYPDPGEVRGWMVQLIKKENE